MSTLGAALKKKRDEESRLAANRVDLLRAISLVAVETETDTTVNTTETTILSKSVSVGGARFLCLRFWGECNVAGALTMTVNLYIDDVLKASSRQICTAAGYWHFDWNPYAEVSQGERTVAVKMQTSASSLEIATGQAQLIIETRGIAGKAAVLDQEVELSLTLMDMCEAPVPQLDVSAVAGSTITPSLTVMNMVGAPSDSLLVVYERNQTGDDSEVRPIGNSWEGQSFTPGVSHNCDTGSIKYRYAGGAGTATFGLYATAAGVPTGAALKSDTLDLTTLALGTGWHYFSWAEEALVATTEYALVLSVAGANASNDPWANMGSVASTSSSTQRTYGWRFQLAFASDITHLMIYPYYTGTYTLHLWRSSDESLLATKTVAATAGQWNSVALDSAVSLDASTDYVVSVNGGSGTPGSYMNRTTPSAANLHPQVTFQQGAYSSGHDTYPKTTTSAYAWGVCGFLFENSVPEFYWRRDGSSPTYANGQRVFSGDAGANWSTDASSDFLFEEGDQK